ncbi:hypothetical protein DV736_g6365, partial [Chaetothyriales sp. CBS 134916]
MGSNSDDSDQDNGLDLFQEPADFYQPEKEPSFVPYELKDGRTSAAANVEKGHLLWNAAQVVTAFIEERATELVEGKTVLELGAGSGLPSLACAIYGARQVVVTDYPDPDLIANLRYNIEHCDLIQNKANITAEGYLWGNSIDSLQQHLDLPQDGFDLLILADILFNHSEHEKIVRTLKHAMKPGPDSTALVFFTPYRPWLLEKDLRFFQLVQEHGFHATKLMEHVMDNVMFNNDPGDELLRRTVFAYERYMRNFRDFPSSMDHHTENVDSSHEQLSFRISRRPILPVRKAKRVVMAKLKGVFSKGGSQAATQPYHAAFNMAYGEYISATQRYQDPFTFLQPRTSAVAVTHPVTLSLTLWLGFTIRRSTVSIPSAPGIVSAPKENPTFVAKGSSQWTVPDIGVFNNKVVYTFNGNTLPDGLTASDYVVQDRLGGAPFDHQFTPANVQVSNGFLNLLVPGGQSPSNSDSLKCAEVITSIPNILYASVRTNAIFSDTGNFFYRGDTQEIDTEYVTDPNSLSRVNSGSPDPIWYVNQAVNPGHDSSTYDTVTAPASDITTNVHEYRIDWTETYTAFYFDGQLQKVFTDNVPSEPGNWLWNNWSNGDKGWSCGPPATDNVFKIQKITMYYNTSDGGGQ